MLVTPKLILRLLVPCALLAACGGDDGPSVEPFYPEDYLAAGYMEGRSCRGSGDHDLSQVHILADPAALRPYLDRTPFPDGVVILKEEYDFADDACTGPILGFTVMKREAASTATVGWRWQKVDLERNVVTSDDRRCIECHGGADEGSCMNGFEGTCADP